MKTKKSMKNTKLKHGQPDPPNPSCLVQSLDKMFEISSLNYSIYSQSIDDYIQKKKPSLRRRVIYHTITVNLLLVSIIYLNVATIKPTDSDVIQYLGAPSSLVHDQESCWLIYVLASQGLLCMIISRCVIHHFENRFECIAYDLFYEIKSGKLGSKVNKINQNNDIIDPFFFFYAIYVNRYLLYAIIMMTSYYTYSYFGTHSDIIMLIVNMSQFLIVNQDII